MVASLLTGETEAREFSDLLRPDPLPDGTHPEERLVVCGVSWDRYLGLDKALGDDRSGPRFYYLDHGLEIMTTSNEHERLKKWISGFVEIYFESKSIEITPRGQATIRDPLQEAGAEPDESWCIGAEKSFPDLVLEIALTSGGLNKLEIYRRFGVPEVWLWRGGKLHIFVLNSGGDYEQTPKSHLLPDLNIPLIERCASIHSWREARQTFRTGQGFPG